MGVRIRLRRIGKLAKGRMNFRISVFDIRRGRDGRCIEELGFYNPTNKKAKIKKERIDFWLKNGAKLSDTVKSLVKKIKEE